MKTGQFRASRVGEVWNSTQSNGLDSAKIPSARIEVTDIRTLMVLEKRGCQS
jgi:hypothetical protein